MNRAERNCGIGIRKLQVPKPQKEFDDVWKWIVDKHRRTRDEQHEKLREERRPDPGNPILNQLDENVRKELSEHTFEILGYRSVNVCYCTQYQETNSTWKN